jgi:hypothetical protein
MAGDDGHGHLVRLSKSGGDDVGLRSVTDSDIDQKGSERFDSGSPVGGSGDLGQDGAQLTNHDQHHEVEMAWSRD